MVEHCQKLKFLQVPVPYCMKQYQSNSQQQTIASGRLTSIGHLPLCDSDIYYPEFLLSNNHQLISGKLPPRHSWPVTGARGNILSKIRCPGFRTDFTTNAAMSIPTLRYDATPISTKLYCGWKAWKKLRAILRFYIILNPKKILY